MKMPLTIIACALPLLGMAQDGWRDTLAWRMHVLDSVVAHADTLSPEAMWDDSTDVNATIGRHLQRVLESPGLSDAALDSLFTGDFFGVARSADGRLRIYSWDENTGGTFRSQAHVIAFRLGTGMSAILGSSDEGEDGLCGLGAGYGAIHLLRSDSASTLYVCIGFTVGCSTCCADVLNVIELTDSTIDLNHPAFPDRPAEQDEEEAYTGTELTYAPCWALDYRCGDGMNFTYHPDERAFTYAYMTDDLTPVQREEGEESRRIDGRIRFDGEVFVVD